MTFIFDSLVPRFGNPSGSEDMRLDDIERSITLLAQSLSSQSGNVSGILKRLKNRHKISIAEGTETFYDDDDTTPIQVNNLLDSNGRPINEAGDIVESVPR